ncbi:MAG: MerR family DNA-binding transcriptional regulator [Elusimicrobia bacterium]|nr:MerR family DNA-binding transcriptional regulator [Elusimicrobiota bacterium]
MILGAPPDKDLLTIGEIGRLTGVPPHTLRYWEKAIGLVRPRAARLGPSPLHQKRFGVVGQGARPRGRTRFHPRGGQAPPSAGSQARAGADALGLRRNDGGGGSPSGPQDRVVGPRKRFKSGHL